MFKFLLSVCAALMHFSFRPLCVCFPLWNPEMVVWIKKMSPGLPSTPSWVGKWVELQFLAWIISLIGKKKQKKRKRVEVSLHVGTILICCACARTKKAIIKVSNCCFGPCVGTRSHFTSLLSHSVSCTESSSCTARLLFRPFSSLFFIFTVFLLFIHLLYFLLLSLLLYFVLPYLLILSHPNARPPARLPPARGCRRLPKSRKRRCVINRAQ